MTMLGKEFGFLEVEPHDPAARRADRDVILLLHGLGGNKGDWAYPKWRGQHWDHRIPAKDKVNNSQLIPPPAFPIPLDPRDQFGLSPKRDDARCWKGILLSKGHTVINYSQNGEQDVAEVPLEQFESLIVDFVKDEVLVDQLAGKRVVLLCHSRGGILARYYLERHKETASSWISKVITLCSPHRGTNSPESKQRLADEATAVLGVAGSLLLASALLALNRLMGVFDESDGATQLLPDSGIFDSLVSPADIPDIEFSTYGGTSPAYSNLYSYRYTIESSIPNPFTWTPWAPFNWRAKPTKLPGSPLLNGIPDVLVDDEQKDGQGDGLVTDLSASLPNTPHRSFPVNHIEALYDEALFADVLDSLGTPVDGSESFECTISLIGNARTNQLHDPSNETANCQLEEIQEVRPFSKVEDGLAAGYDGCYYCLSEYHTS